MLTSVILETIGGLVVIGALVGSLWSVLELITSFLMPYFIPSAQQTLQERFGTWAVITGSTDGIGKQYALELARRGINVVLISRSPDKLARVAKEIESRHNVKTKIIVADFCQGKQVFPHIEAELQDIPVGILVNNVGLQYDYPMPLCELPLSKAWDIINVNVGVVTALTRLVLPTMLARGRGAIVNVSSGAEFQPMPLMNIYGATKAYIGSFTRSLREEYGSKDIFVQHLIPFFVVTKMNAFSRMIMDGNILVPDVETYAKYAVATLGKVHTTSGYWIHGLQSTCVSFIPLWIRTKISYLISSQLRLEYMQTVKRKY